MSESVAIQSDVVPVDYKSVLDGILQLDLNSCTMTVCLASVAKHETVPCFERLRLAEELGEEFRTIIRNHLKEYEGKWQQDELPFSEYNVESEDIPFEADGEHLSLVDYSHILEQLTPLQALTGIDVFQEDEHFVSGLRFYVIIAQPLEGDPVYFFRSHSSKGVLTRSHKFAIWNERGSYNRVKTPIILIDEKIDCMSRSGLMYVLNKPSFQNIFRFFEEVQRTAKVTLSTIKQHIPIQNFEEFEQDCERHLWKLRKLGNMASKPYLHRISIEHIKHTINKHRLSVRVDMVDGREMIVYDPKDKWVLLRLLDDDYLWSTLTEQGYEVNGKKELA